MLNKTCSVIYKYKLSTPKAQRVQNVFDTVHCMPGCLRRKHDRMSVSVDRYAKYDIPYNIRHIVR